MKFMCSKMIEEYPLTFLEALVMMNEDSTVKCAHENLYNVYWWIEDGELRFSETFKSTNTACTGPSASSFNDLSKYKWKVIE